MSVRTTATINTGRTLSLTAAALLLAAVTSPAPGQDAPESYDLTGIVRDFLSSHVDFNVVPDQGFGHYAGNVDAWLPTGTNRPIYTGGGFEVDQEWLDAMGRPIAPHMAGVRNGLDESEVLGIRVSDSILLRDDTSVDAFNSNYGPYGMQGNFGADAVVSTNSVAAGAIELRKKSFIRGDVFVGPGGDPNEVIFNQGIINGTKAPLDEAYTIPEVVVPENDEDTVDLLPFVPVIDLAGTVTLTGDTDDEDDVDAPAMWTGELTLHEDAVLTVQGDLRVRVDGDLTVRRAQIVLLPDANLTFYVSGDVLIDDESLINTSPGDTTALAINAIGPGQLRLLHRSHVYATVVASQRLFELQSESHFYGSYVGQALEIRHKGSGIHVDNGNAFLGYRNYALTLRDKVDLDDGSQVDSFDSNVGPYGGANVGANALVTTNSRKNDHVKLRHGSVIHGDVLVGPLGDPDRVIDMDSNSSITGTTGSMSAPIAIPVITAPQVGSSQGHLHWTDGGTYTIDSDMRCKHLKLDHGTVVNIVGDVTIRCDGKVELKHGSEIRLMPGARLTLYVKKKVKLEDNSKFNMNTGNPQLVWIQKMGHGKKGKVEVKNGSQLVAWVQGAKTDLKVENDSDFYGSFAGKRVKAKNNSRLHIDTAYISSCVSIDDTAGAAGAESNEAITSEESFSQWFRDVLGVNLALMHEITMTRNADGVYEYLDSGFYPVDGQLFGNEGGARNDYFTYTLAADFTYEECGGQWLEFQGGDGVWMFVDSQLVMDLGGVLAITPQFVELDRLSLEDGRTYRLHVFYANRSSFSAVYRLRTNMVLSTDGVPTVNSLFD